MQSRHRTLEQTRWAVSGALTQDLRVLSDDLGIVNDLDIHDHSGKKVLQDTVGMCRRFAFPQSGESGCRIVWNPTGYQSRTTTRGHTADARYERPHSQKCTE